MYFSDPNAHPGILAGSHFPRQAGNASSEASSVSASGTGDSSSSTGSAAQPSAPTSSVDPASSSTQGGYTSATSTSKTGDGQSSSTSVQSTSDSVTSSPSSTQPPSSQSTSTSLSSSLSPTSLSSSASTPSSTPISTPTSSVSPTNTLSSSPSPSPSSSTSPTNTSATSQPTSSLSQSYSTSYTVVNGVTSSSLVSPTTLSSAPPTSLSSNERSAIIAGSATGGALLLILALSILFYRRRKEFKRLGFIDMIAAYRRQKHSRATLLDGEDLEDVHMSRPPPGRYSDYETPWDPSTSHMSSRSLAAGQNQNSSTPSILLRARGSESGSVFYEEVWPPPGDRSRLLDPLGDHSANYSDLSRIVDDVMGPSAATQGIHYSQYSLSSSMREPSGDSLHSGLHSRSWSADSQSQLLEAAGLVPSSTPPSPSRQPIKPSPLAESNAAAGGSMTAATSKNWLHRSPLKNEVDPRDGLADDMPRAL